MTDERLLNQSRQKLLQTIFNRTKNRGQLQYLTDKRETRLYWESTSSTKINQIPLKQTSKELGEYLTGFWEGDGYIQGLESGYTDIGLVQKLPEILFNLQDLLEGGNIYYKKTANFYQLAFGGRQACQVLSILAPNLVGASRLKQLSPFLKVLDIEARLQCPTPSWFVGFWDAEGTSSHSSYTTLSVSNKDKTTINQIYKLWKSGHINSRRDGVYIWSLSSAPKYSRVFQVVYNLLLDKSLNKEKRVLLRSEHRLESFTEGKLED